MHAVDADDLPGAEALLSEASQSAVDLRDPRLTAHLRRVEATLAAARRDHAQAFALYQESFALYRELGDAWMAGIVEWTVGVSATVLGRFEEARAHFAACLTNGLDLGNRWGVPYPLEAFAVLALAEHQYERGAKLLGAAEALRASFGMSPAPAAHPALLALISSASAALATPEAAAARNAGRAMSFKEAIAFALAAGS